MKKSFCVRTLIACLVAVGLTGFIPAEPAVATTSPAPEFRLRLFNTHTGEHLDVIYRRGDSYLPEALTRLDDYLKDRRTGDVHHYDPRVFDLLHELETKLGLPDSEIDVLCGYRSPWTNEFLRTHRHGVALHSLHMLAMAIDIRIPGVRTSKLRDAALSLHRGGVGYYAKSGFVHVDVGRVRRWQETIPTWDRDIHG
jgi:uncharacterized protein YcbK (DUF882 family)